MPQPQPHRIRAVSATYATAHCNTGSLTPLSGATDQTRILMHTSQLLNPLSHNRNSLPFHFKESTGLEKNTCKASHGTRVRRGQVLAPSRRVAGVCLWGLAERARWQETRSGDTHSLSPHQQLGGFKGSEGACFPERLLARVGGWGEVRGGGGGVGVRRSGRGGGGGGGGGGRGKWAFPRPERTSADLVALRKEQLPLAECLRRATHVVHKGLTTTW